MKISLCRPICFWLVGLLAVTLIAACNTVNKTSATNHKLQDANCRVVQHTMGKTCIPHHPQRMVVLHEEALANSVKLGFRPIASVYEPNTPLPKYLQGKVTKVESVGGYGSPNLEKILYLKPDLILADSYYSENFYEQLSQIAPTVVLNIPFPPPTWKEQLEALAQILGKENVAQQLIDDYWQRIKQLKQALGIGAASPKENRRHPMQVSVASAGSEYGIWAYGERHFSGTILSDIGLQRPRAQQGDLFYVEGISEETISSIDGDVLFFLTWDQEDDKKALEKLKQEPLWQQLNVVQRDQVYFVGKHWHDANIFAINAILDDLEKYLVNSP
ncbi:MAG: iron-siderophore ABC transporter substrate-binding protein [Elainella sp. C42_A2020_010]|nr:iron-siderophore ABC transporter substrate-binding protein [Elainella sp. C42_A2020_010]